MNKDKSWIKIRNWIPFRSYYMYWDKNNTDGNYYGDIEFINRKISVKFKNFEYKHNNFPFIAVFVTCWRKDEKKVEEALNILNDRLKALDPNYELFLKDWCKVVEQVEY